MGNTMKNFDAKRIPKGYYYISGVGTVFGVSVLVKDYYGGRKYEEKHEIRGKTVIITGANAGIGKETARGLAMRGGRVIMACRDMERCELARREVLEHSVLPNIECRELDLASCESIRNFVQKLKDEKREVDILINNAGVMCPPKLVTKDGFEWQLGVNYLGHFLLTMLLLDKLKASQNGRIVNLVSPMFKRGTINFEDLNSNQDYNPKEAYGQSKLALVLFTEELARRLEGTNVTVNCVNPGVVKTAIGRHLPMGQARVSGSLLSPIMWLFCKSPFQGSQTSVFLAVDPIVEKVSGKYFSDLKEDTVPAECSDKEVACRLWIVSEKWTKLDT